MIKKSRTERTALDYIEKIVLTSDPYSPKWNTENYIFHKQPKWNYMDCCMIRALLMYAEDEPEYLAYAERFIDSYVCNDGRIPTFKADDFNLDSICGGNVLLRLYELTGKKHYAAAAKMLYEEQLKRQPRISCGNFWHKAIYPNQVWLDGVYMALPFLASYGKFTGDISCIEDAISQVRNIRDIMRDSGTGLYYHGYSEDRDLCWADKETGLSSEFWLRSNGWLCAGLADLYEITGDSECGEILCRLLESLKDCLTDDGMLLQLPARPELSGNYRETSGTLLFAYSAIKAHNLGVVADDIAEAGYRALETVTERFIVYDNDVPVLKNICFMGGLGGAENRDGSAQYYLSERVIENDAKGIAPYLMACAQL